MADACFGQRQLPDHYRTLSYDPRHLDISRTDGIVIVRTTLNEGRTTDIKKILYNALAQTLNGELSIRLEDVFVNPVELKKETWSLGNGVAQYP